MPKFTVAEEFDIAIKAAAKTAKRTVSSRQLAEDFYESEPEIVSHFQREWGIETVRALIAGERSRLARSKNIRRQLGFGTVGKIILKTGEPYRDSTATLWVLQQLKKQLGATDHPALTEVLRRIEFLQPYAQEKRAITFPQACKLAAAKAGLIE